MFRYCFLSLSILAAFWSYAQKPDTLTNLPAGAQIYAPQYDQTGQWGYLLGQNSVHRQQFAEKYYVEGMYTIKGLIAHLAGTYEHPLNYVEFNVYAVGENRLPGNRLGGRQVLYQELDLSGDAMPVTFNAPITVQDSFYVTFNVFDYVHGGYDGDTLGLYMGVDGTRSMLDLANFGRNAIQAHNHHKEDWKDFYTQNFTPIATHFALFPIVEVVDETVLTVNNQSLEINIFPNPAVDRIQIVPKESIDYIVIYDLMGHVMYQEENVASQSMDVSDWSPGSYVMKMTTGTKTFVKKVIIQPSEK